MKIIVAGGRDFEDYDLLKESINRMIQNLNKDDITIISGTAKGADLLGEQFAKEYNLKLIRIPANWDKYGKGAGFKRNYEMAKLADVLIAFWDNSSKGTMHMINIANKQKLQVKIFKYIN